MKYVLALATLSAVALGSTGALAASHYRSDGGTGVQQQGWNAPAQAWTPGYPSGAQPAYEAYAYRPANGYLPEMRSNDSNITNADQNYGSPDRY